MTDHLSSSHEDELLRQHLVTPSRHDASIFRDDLYSRLAHVVQGAHDSDLDLAVLFRHLLRRWSLAAGRNVRVETASSLSVRLRRAAETTHLREGPPDTWFAPAWQPAWLDQSGTPDDPPGTPDAAAAAGTVEGLRFHQEELAADPFFRNITGHDSYRTPGQQAACRAAVSMPDGSTLIAMLPTGSGKTEIALCLADRHPYTLTLVVVPTVALAYDFERRFRNHYARKYPRADKNELHFAWTGSTGEEFRERLRNRVLAGTQPLLVTSPESVSRSLRSLLAEAASVGRLSGFVIDEAHLVTQWGRDFRPEFRTLADLRNGLRQRAREAGHPRPTTLLLSATLGAHELGDLHALFGNDEPCSLIAANALRAEPDLWISEAEDGEQREGRVLEALAHLPRPAVLYVTSPETAEWWLSRLREAGYRRAATVTGETSAAARAQVLAGLRSTDGAASTVDLVVATSAFGLGIDYGHIRTIVHACLPETVDRWYQELGRGGRDGSASVALLVIAPEDRREALRLGTTVLKAETARARWVDLWSHRQEVDGRSFVDLEGSRGVARGSYNRRWNAQLVQGLVELGGLRRLQFDADDLRELAGDSDQVPDWAAVELTRADLLTPEFWKDEWTPWQEKEARRSTRALDLMTSLASLSVPACEAIAQAYRPDDGSYKLFPDVAYFMEPVSGCGRCPGCRRAGRSRSEESAPWPPQGWPLADDLSAALGDLADAAGAQERLIILLSDDHPRVAPQLARSLLKRGVRHIAGVGGIPVEVQDWLFVDSSPIAPDGLTPCSSFVICPPRHRLRGSWLNLRVRRSRRANAPQAFDVLLVPYGASIGGLLVGREIKALDADSALQILGS